jgi:hypothetical protein
MLEVTMKLARAVFLIAGLSGLTILTPLYFTFDLVGRSYPPAITHPDFYYGFISVAWVWQIAFLMIARNPVRHRPFMLAAILEKLIYVTTIVSLYVNGNVRLAQAAVAVPDFVLALLFVAAFTATPDADSRSIDYVPTIPRTPAYARWGSWSA